MTPPRSTGASRSPLFLNLQGRTLPTLEAYDVGTSVDQLQSLARLSATVHAGRVEDQHQAYRRLLLLDAGGRGHERLEEHSAVETGTIYSELRHFIGRAREGDLPSYSEAMLRYFLLADRMLGDAQHAAQVPAMLGEFEAFARRYMTAIGQAETSSEDRFRMLYFAGGVIHNLLGRTQEDAEAGESAGDAVMNLAVLLNEYCEAALEQHSLHLLAHPGGESYTPVVREIQMRQALIQGDEGAARQRARELVADLRAHPPGDPDPNLPETRRWDLQGMRLLAGDPQFHRLVQNLDSHSSVENAGALLNGVSLELLLACASGIDFSNGESEEDISNRYAPLSSVVAVLSLTRPQATLRVLLESLGNASNEDSILAEVEAALEANPALATALEESRGETSLHDWVGRSVRAAAHVQELGEGPGSGLFSTLLVANETNHPIRSLADMLQQHPALLAELGLSAAEFRSETARYQAALELLHRGSLGIALLQSYQERNPGAALRGIIEILGDENLAASRINSTLTSVLESFHTGLDARPDHEIAALHGVFQILGHTSTIAEGVELDPRLATHSREVAARMEGYGFRTERAWGHMTSAPSLATMAAGIFVSEAAPALMIFRAGSAGRLVARGIPLVRGGALTWQGAATTGIGTGLAMSLIGSGMHNAERSSYGLQTHFWNDFGHGAVVNTLTFAGTIPFQRWLAGRLAPGAGNARSLGQLSRSGRLGVHIGTALFGTGLALGLNTGMRRLHSGEWSAPSYEEVAETYMGLLAWELGAAGFRRLRTRVGLRPALEGRRPFEPLQFEVPEGASPFQRFRATLNNGVNRAAAAVVNPLFTVLGEHRAQMVRTATQRIIDGNPQLAPLEDIIAHRLATEEISAPGSLDQYTETFLRNHQLEIGGEPGQPRLLFVLGGTRRAPSQGYTEAVVRSIREQLETCSADDPAYLPRYLPRSPYEIVQIRIDPITRQIVGVGTHVFAESVEGAMVINASYNPQTRTLRLPPLHGESDGSPSFRTGSGSARRPQMVEIDMGPMFDAHSSSPLPMVWTEATGTGFLGQRLNQAARARINQALGDLNRDTAIRLPIDIETGRILDGLVAPRSAEDLPPPGTRVLRMTGRYDGSSKEIRIPAPRGQEGEYIVDMNTGRIRHELPEGAETPAAAERPARSRSERSRRATPADPVARMERQALTPEQLDTLMEAADGGSADVTVFFGNNTGRVLGISRGHHSERTTPQHVLSENLLANGRVPRRLALQGRLLESEGVIRLEVPASEEGPAGTLHIDLESGELSFEASAPETSSAVAEPVARMDAAESEVIEDGIVDLSDALEPDDSSGPHGGSETE